MPAPTLDAIHEKEKELNEKVLPPGVKIVPMLDRSDLLRYTTHTVLHNLTEGMILVTILLLFFLGNVRAALTSRSRFPSRCWSRRSSSTWPRSRPTCSRSARSISEWWWTAPW